ncbi:hypothetical protein F5Y05DRAFT_387455 [Hypoxylon sp. FL0543]|nr:hypothetical protein F5Y05DRAFT_387455 [Hypoxylon sp. FL0543]
MIPEPEPDVLAKCIEVASRLCNGQRLRGYRAPTHTILDTAVGLLREFGFLYNSSLMHHASQSY